MPINQSAIRRLIRILNDESTWPEDFLWDYDSCESCALGLARDKGIIPNNNREYAEIIFGMTANDVERIFYELPSEENLNLRSWSACTPQHVSRELEKLLIEEKKK